ncbi:hypothetical protein TrVE_jg8414 [Triparma verrucosa]|uniref:Uncharacterized protein n=1 Tax=Triparma verrucosa TaxID=1606542 RepID=A0A9W7CCS0_9STRA|nr:hypothetical protein TrVE_jg8414 [Triparma verrucosa]
MWGVDYLSGYTPESSSGAVVQYGVIGRTRYDVEGYGDGRTGPEDLFEEEEEEQKEEEEEYVEMPDLKAMSPQPTPFHKLRGEV